MVKISPHGNAYFPGETVKADGLGIVEEEKRDDDDENNGAKCSS